MKTENANVLRCPPVAYAAALLATGLVSLSACHRSNPAAESPTPSEQRVRAERAAQAPEETQRQWDYLNRIRQSITLSSSIDRTQLDDQNRLGIVLFSSVTPEQVPALIHQVMPKMAEEFPRTDLTLDVYQSATPLKKLGTAKLNGQTGEVIYTPTK
ncbi:MAG TPA: hypothetical protein VGL24_13540 [Chthoniobacterales bacterium]|jgi:hypothetical protein